MTGQQETITIEIVPVDQITVINPRIRNRKIFRQIIDSISRSASRSRSPSTAIKMEMANHLTNSSVGRAG